MTNKIAIIFCVESGYLEDQALLLIRSCRQFFKGLNIQLIAFSPRVKNFPLKLTKNILAEYSVKVLKKNINVSYLNYPIANKVLACEYIEINHPEYQSILFVDTDTIFLNNISDTLINNTNTLYLRPVDNKGPGTTGDNDCNDQFWKKVFQLFNLECPRADLTTTVRQKIIRPYFNAGFIWANGLPGFFQQWKKDFVKLVDSGLRPFGYQSRDNTDFRCLDQVALAVTAQRYQQNISILPQTYNYPIPFRPILKNRANHPNFDDLVHVHYHKWFQHPYFLDYITNEKEKQSKQYLWLKELLPLAPNIKGNFKC